MNRHTSRAKLPYGSMLRTIVLASVVKGASNAVGETTGDVVQGVDTLRVPGHPFKSFDARRDQWIVNVAIGPRPHSVAANPVTGRVFVPIAASGSKRACPSGCIAVFGGR